MMSHMERHAWITLAAFTAIAAALAVRLFALGDPREHDSADLFLTATFCYLLFAASDYLSRRMVLRRPSDIAVDERDEMIERRAGNAALWFVVLATLFLVHQTVAGHQADPDALSLIDLTDTTTLFFVLLIVFLGAFIAQRGAMIVAYRARPVRAE